MKINNLFLILIFVLMSSAIFASDVRLLITPPSDDGGSALIEYIIEYRREDQSRWRKHGTVDVPKNEKGMYLKEYYLIKDLNPGFNYYFRVSVVNGIGKGQPGDHAECFIERENEIYHGIPITSGNGYPKAKSRTVFDVFDLLLKNDVPNVQIPYRVEE